MFDSLVVSVMAYEAEIWGWKERTILEKIKQKYIKWSLGFEQGTPDCIVYEETKRDKLCVDERRKGKGNKSNLEDRMNFFKECGYSQEGIDKLREEGVGIGAELRERGYKVQRQHQGVRIQTLKNIRYQEI